MTLAGEITTFVGGSAMPLALNSIVGAAGGALAEWISAWFAEVSVSSKDPSRERLLGPALGFALGVAATIVVPGLDGILAVGLGVWLLALGLTDLRTLRLPDLLTLPLAVAGLALCTLRAPSDFADHAIGAVLAWVLLTGLSFLYRWMRGREGLGLGDAKLLAAAGAWLGWRPLPGLVLIACALAFVWVGVRALRSGRASLSQPLAFGAPLCAAFWIMQVYGAGAGS